MLSSATLSLTLSDLDTLYNEPGAVKNKQDYFAKLALIELCGWIEEYIDEIARDYCYGIRDINELESILNAVHGFNYANLRSILVQIAGIGKILELEKELQNNGVSYDVLKSQLGALTGKRNSAAHSHLTGTQTTYDAPSVIMRELSNIEPALKELKAELDALA